MARSLLPMDADRLNEEWKSLPGEGDSEYAVARKYSEKNRYVDVLPYETSRVNLTPSEDNPDGYINANLMHLPQSLAIATQGPLPQTFLEFWQMIWEMEVRIIVMLTKLLERRRVKAHCYWPTIESGPQTFGEISIQSLETTSYDNFVLRTFTIKNGALEREIYQVQYTDWPDFGVPISSTSILELLQVIGEQREKLGLAAGRVPALPHTLVHCSAGIGRCGTLLSIFSAIEKLAEGVSTEQLSIPEIVSSLRAQRAGMVQTREQYEFIYQVVNDYIQAQDQGIKSFIARKKESDEAIHPPTDEARPRKRDLRSTKRPLRQAFNSVARPGKPANALHQTKSDWKCNQTGQLT